MSATPDHESQVVVENPDEAIVREMERRLAKKETSREWRLWFIVLGAVLGIPIILWVAGRLLQSLLMSGF